MDRIPPPPRRKSFGRREFSDEELKDLRTAFDLCDRNQDGRITTSELQFMFNKLGIHFPDERIQQLVRNASHTGNELLSESEFMLWVKRIQSLLPSDVAAEEDLAQDLIAAFRVFDVERNGYITRKELRTAIEIIGEPVTEQQLTEFIRMTTKDKQGRINYEEFAKQFS